METTSLILKRPRLASKLLAVLGNYHLSASRLVSWKVASRWYLQGLALLEDPQREVGHVPHDDPLPLRGFVNHLSLRATWPEKHGESNVR